MCHWVNDLRDVAVDHLDGRAGTASLGGTGFTLTVTGPFGGGDFLVLQHDRRRVPARVPHWPHRVTGEVRQARRLHHLLLRRPGKALPGRQAEQVRLTRDQGRRSELIRHHHLGRLLLGKWRCRQAEQMLGGRVSDRERGTARHQGLHHRIAVDRDSLELGLEALRAELVSEDHLRRNREFAVQAL